MSPLLLPQCFVRLAALVISFNLLNERLFVCNVRCCEQNDETRLLDPAENWST